MIISRILVIHFTIFFLTINGLDNSDHSRSLVISNGGVVKLIVGMAMPIELPVSLIWLQNLQFQYFMIDNAAQLTYLSLLRRSQSFQLTRSSAYELIAQIWDGLGINGTACLLRTICEVSRLPPNNYNLLGSLLSTIFTPHPSTDPIYISATIRNSREGCNQYRSNCIDKFSTSVTRFLKKPFNN